MCEIYARHGANHVPRTELYPRWSTMGMSVACNKLQLAWQCHRMLGRRSRAVAAAGFCEIAVPAGRVVDGISGVGTSVYARNGVYNYQGGLFRQADAGQHQSAQPRHVIHILHKVLWRGSCGYTVSALQQILLSPLLHKFISMEVILQGGDIMTRQQGAADKGADLHRITRKSSRYTWPGSRPAACIGNGSSRTLM
jgi:hypothetical protein